MMKLAVVPGAMPLLSPGFGCAAAADLDGFAAGATAGAELL